MESQVTVHKPDPSTPPERNLGKLFIVAVAVLILVAVILVFMMWPRPQAVTPSTTEQAKTEANILTRTQQNTSRKNDASQIAAGIAEYMSNNQGSLPTATGGSGYKVELCSATCESDAAKTTVTLNVYKADSIHLTISPSIAKPDDNNVYLIRQAMCTTDGRGVSSTAGTSRQLAISYALDAGGGQVEEHCQDL